MKFKIILYSKVYTVQYIIGFLRMVQLYSFSSRLPNRPHYLGQGIENKSMIIVPVFAMYFPRSHLLITENWDSFYFDMNLVHIKTQENRSIEISFVFSVHGRRSPSCEMQLKLHLGEEDGIKW